MKTFNSKVPRCFAGIAALLTCMIGFSACSTAPLTTLDTVGPKPADVHPSGPMLGYLKVYNSTREYANGDVTYSPHRRYFLYNLAGARIKTVDNRSSRKDEEPQSIPLPVGKYYVVAETENDTLVRVPVVIKGGSTTFVNLERGTPVGSGLKDADASRTGTGPEGQVVGWRANF
jgi:hypothetical protein